jgi:single-stranded DNA-binding protein
MSRGLKKLMVNGRLGKAPETRFTPNGTSFANFSLDIEQLTKT